MNVDPVEREVEDLRHAMQPHAPEEGALLSRFVIVAEWLLPDDTKTLTSTRSEGMESWDEKGFLEYAQDEPDSDL